LLSIVDQTPQLSEGSRRRAASYLGESFDLIGSPAKISDMLKTCLP
jgi:hypothetical protein